MNENHPVDFNPLYCLLMKICFLLIFISITSTSIQAKEIVYNSFRESCKLAKKAPISLEMAYSIAFQELSARNYRVLRQQYRGRRLGVFDVRTIGEEYFFPLQWRHKYKKRKEIGIYISSTTGIARFVFNENNEMVYPIRIFDEAHENEFLELAKKARESAFSKLKKIAK